MNIAEKIKMKRKEKKWNQTELATLIGISQNYISQIESGKSQPTADVIKGLCKALEISANWLLLDEEENRLKQDEQELITIYRKLPETNKQRLIGRAEAMLEEIEENKKLDKEATS